MRSLSKWRGALLLGVVLLSSCATVASRIPGGIPIPSGAGKGIQTQTLGGGADFRDGEVLSASGTDPYGEDFYLARVVTQPSAATKNQAEVIYIRDGKKEWVNFVFPSRKAAKQDLVVGKVLFAPVWHRESKEINEEEYRKGLWKLGRVTSVDDLFKDIVEMNGSKYYWQWLRVPDREP